jgi:LPS-assembly protein
LSRLVRGRPRAKQGDEQAKLGAAGSDQAQRAATVPWLAQPLRHRATRPIALCLLLGLSLELPLYRAEAANQIHLFPTNQLPRRPQSAPLDPNGQVLVRADEVTYDENNEIVTATGNVELSQGERVLLADTVSYNRRTEIVTASGNLSLLEPTGEVIFGNYSELAGDLKDGIIQDFRALLIDNSRIAAAAATRKDGDRKEMSKGVFSPCNLCQDDPAKAPLWQIKGERIIHDETRHKIVYHDAQIELDGIPVFYTPYLSHPDPTIKRLSGFLPPTLGNSTTLGTFFGLPYYGVIDESSDFTIEPEEFTQQGETLDLEYRKQFVHGSFRLAGSIADVNSASDNKSASTRGNLVAEGLYDIDDEFRGGFSIARVTDRTYTREFKIPETFVPITQRFAGTFEQNHVTNYVGDPNQLTSTAYLEGFQGRNYEEVSAYDFQTLRAGDNQKAVARIHPFAEYSAYYTPELIGGYFRFDTNILALSRAVGIDSDRISGLAGYYLPFRTGDGSLFTWATTVQADRYKVDGLNLDTTTTNTFNGTSGRVYPQTALKWQYPLFKHGETRSYLIEPTVQIVAGTRGSNPTNVPNEDSRSFELDETNLFALQRFPGRDRVSSGQRIDYGIDLSTYGDHSGSGRLFLGQSVRAQHDGTYALGSGLEHNLSDAVGVVSIQPQKWIDFSYRVRLDSRDLSLNRQEIATTMFGWNGYLSISYVEFEKKYVDALTSLNSGETTTTATTINGIETIPAVRSLQLVGSVPVTEYWKVIGTYVADVKLGQTQNAIASLVYRDECFGVALTYERDYFIDTGIKPSDTFLVRVGLKYLGDFGG